jgi:uncharacterized protein DUF1206
MNATVETARGEAKQAARSEWVEWIGRAGLVAQGLSFGLVAVLAIKVAVHQGGKTTDREGALRTLADETSGKLLIGALALGFLCYAVWRFAQALFDRMREGDDLKGLGKRASYLGKGLLYLGFFLSAMSILLGEDAASGQGEEKHATAGVLGWPAGRWLVGTVGLIVLGAGLWNGYRALSGRFRKELKTEEMSEGEERTAVAIAVLGLLARLVVFSLIGIFLIRAAVQYDPQEAIGLDGALAKVANEPYGSYLLGLLAAALGAYGFFCLIQARYRRV